MLSVFYVCIMYYISFEYLTGHSFRRSSKSLLANAGADIPNIMRHGGWKSPATAETYYVKNSLQYKKKPKI